MTSDLMLTADDLGAVVSAVWEEGLRLYVAGLDEGAVGTPDVLGRVEIHGGFTGSVTLAAATATVAAAAEQLSGIAAEELPEEAVLDAFGELTNMVGGNLKALLPGPSDLGLPAVSSYDEVPGEPLLRVTVHSELGPVVVSLWGS